MKTLRNFARWLAEKTGWIIHEEGDLTVEKLQQMVGAQVESRGGYWSTIGMLLKLFEEIGELMTVIEWEKEFTRQEIRYRQLQQLHNECSHCCELNSEAPQKKGGREKKSSLESELSDAIYALICIANAKGIALTPAIKRKVGIFQVRDAGRFLAEEEAK